MMTEFLLDSTREHPAKIDFKRVDREKRTALSIAVSLGNREIVQILLADGRSDLGRAREDGMIPLHIAISFNRCELVMMLLAYGSPYIRTDRSGLTSMHLAAGLGHRGILSALWARHDPKTILPDSGVTKETPAFIAVKRNDLDTYKLLRTMDYQAEKTNASGETCLYLAVYLGFEDFVQVSGNRLIFQLT
jgi:ankyrin repeat protein